MNFIEIYHKKYQKISIYILLLKIIRKTILIYNNRIKLYAKYKLCFKNSFVDKTTYIINPEKLKIGSFSTISHSCKLDCRGNINIGKNCIISSGAKLITASHNIHSTEFELKLGSILVGNNCWIAEDVTILPGTIIGKGSVIGAGSVISGAIEPYSIIGKSNLLKYKRKKCHDYWIPLQLLGLDTIFLKKYFFWRIKKYF